MANGTSACVKGKSKSSVRRGLTTKLDYKRDSSAGQSGDEEKPTGFRENQRNSQMSRLGLTIQQIFPPSDLKNRLHAKNHPAQQTAHAEIQCTQFAISHAAKMAFRILVFNGAEYSVPEGRGAVLRPPALPGIGYPRRSYRGGVLRVTQLSALPASEYSRRSYGGAALRFNRPSDPVPME
jgi:hypothetical protein